MYVLVSIFETKKRIDIWYRSACSDTFSSTKTGISMEMHIKRTSAPISIAQYLYIYIIFIAIVR